MTTSEYGSVREVWFAKLADPSTKWSFLIRDDAYTKQGQSFGRTIRLGDPVTLGPNSSWTQLSWEGGSKQDLWSDKQMFAEGSLDPQTKTGKLRLWTGFSHLNASTGRLVHGFVFGRGAQGSGDSSTPLYIGETRLWGATSLVPTGGFQIKRWDPTKAANAHIVHLTGGPNGGTTPFMNILAEQINGPLGSIVCVTTENGMWFFFEAGGTWGHDTNAFTGPYHQNGLVSYNDALFYLSNNALCKRVPLANNLVLGTHSIVRQIQEAMALRCLTVFNNRLYYTVNYSAGRAAVEVSDGVTTSRAFEFPDEFVPYASAAHYGSLYFVGGKPGADGPLATRGRAELGQVWRYNGSTLVKIWEDGDPRDGLVHSIRAVTTYGPNLVWCRNGYPKDGTGNGLSTNASGSMATNRPCLMFYDAEKDAVFEGPGIDFPSGNTEGVLVTNAYKWDNTLVASFFDNHDYGSSLFPVVESAAVRLGDKVRHSFALVNNGATGGSQSFVALNSGTRTGFVLSSSYNGEEDVALETKTWLSGKIRCRVPVNTQVRVALIPDEGTEVSVETITYSGDSGWRTVTFPLKSSGDYIQATKVQYKVYLDNTDTNVDSTAVPEVDDIYVAWRVAPLLQRSWRVRAIAQDAQLRLDDTANTLTTQALLEAKLQELYQEGKPVLFWDAEADGVTPVGSGTEVNVTDFMVQAYRLLSDTDEVVSEASLTLVENVT